MLSLADLSAMSLPELEALWLSRPSAAVPSGLFRGQFLHWVDSAGARKPHVRGLDTLGFRWANFGIDFDESRWWFVSPMFRAGRFALSAGPSRWRDTDVLRLTYDVSRLPRPIRSALYDEVKPLSDRLVLGLGGLNSGPGDGDHFFFALSRNG